MKSLRIGGMLAGLAVVTAHAGEVSAQGSILLALTREWVEAETARDERALRRILDDRLVATFGVGQPVGKEAYVKAVMTPGPSRMLGHDLRDETVVIDGDTGVVVGTDAIRKEADGVQSTVTYRYTATYIRHDAQWTVLALHMVKFPPPKN